MGGRPVDGAVAGGFGEGVGGGLVAAELRGEGLWGAAEICNCDGSCGDGAGGGLDAEVEFAWGEDDWVGCGVVAGRVTVWVVALLAWR